MLGARPRYTNSRPSDKRKHPDQRNGRGDERQRGFQEATDFRAVFACEHFRVSFGLTCCPDRYSLDPAADGVFGLAAADAASFLNMELCLLGLESQGFPGCNVGMGSGQRKCPSAIIAMFPLHRGPTLA